MSTDKPSIAVVGAGPAGLAFALAARQAGLHPEVFEQAMHFRQIGGGLLLHGNGLRVLRALGLARALEPMLQPIHRLEIVVVDRGRTFVRDLSCQPPPHERAAVIMRYCLQEELLAATRRAEIPVHLGRRLVALELRSGGCTLRFENGGEVDADLVIGADGVHSRVRASIKIAARLRELGQAYLRGVSERPADGFVAREYLGPGGRRFGTLPLPNDRTYFYCTAPLGEWHQVRGTKLSEWMGSWRPFGKEVMETLQAVPDWGAVNYDEIREVRLRRWCHPPVFLIGDAAHAMTPDLGQGANSAIVDALVLARLLGQAYRDHRPLQAAADQYERLRRPFVRQIQRLSYQTARLFTASSRLGRRMLYLLLVLGDWLAALSRRSLQLATGLNPREEPYLGPLAGIDDA